jgi:hypothetical protein
MPQTSITVTMSAQDLLKIPYEGCLHLIQLAVQRRQISPEFIQELYDAERVGKARWPVLNRLREFLANPPPFEQPV